MEAGSFLPIGLLASLINHFGLPTRLSLFLKKSYDKSTGLLFSSSSSKLLSSISFKFALFLLSFLKSEFLNAIPCEGLLRVQFSIFFPTSLFESIIDSFFCGFMNPHYKESEGFLKLSRGRLKVNVVPSFSLDFTFIIPPIALTILLLTVRLKPIPVD